MQFSRLFSTNTRNLSKTSNHESNVDSHDPASEFLLIPRFHKLTKNERRIAMAIVIPWIINVICMALFYLAKVEKRVPNNFDGETYCSPPRLPTLA